VLLNYILQEPNGVIFWMIGQTNSYRLLTLQIIKLDFEYFSLNFKQLIGLARHHYQMWCSCPLH